MNIPFNPRNIKTEADIRAFFVWLVNDQNLNFHPDTPFEDYVRYGTDDRVYSDEIAVLLNAVMDRCFEIKEDTYEIGLEVIKEYIFPHLRANHKESNHVGLTNSTRP